eukprot:gene30609-36985_t
METQEKGDSECTFDGDFAQSKGEQSGEVMNICEEKSESIVDGPSSPTEAGENEEKDAVHNHDTDANDDDNDEQGEKAIESMGDAKLDSSCDEEMHLEKEEKTELSHTVDALLPENEMSQVILGFHQSDVSQLSRCYSDYHPATGLVELIETLRIDRGGLPTDLNELKLLLAEIVTKEWHPLYLALLALKPAEGLPRGYFIELCEQYASTEYEAALKISRERFRLVSSSSKYRAIEKIDYSNVAETIAGTLLLHNEQEANTQRKPCVDYLLSLKCDLHLRRQRFVVQLAKALCGVELCESAVRRAHIAMRRNTVLSSLKTFSMESIALLREIGLADELLDAIAYCFSSHKSARQLPIIKSEEVEGWEHIRSVILSKHREVRAAFKWLVTSKWHPFCQVLAHNTVNSFEDFLILCDEYAKEEYALAHSAEVQDKLQFIVTSNGLRKVFQSNYSDISLTIANAIAQHDSAYKVKGITNENYIILVCNGFISKKESAVTRVFEKVFNLDLRKTRMVSTNPGNSHLESGESAMDSKNVKSIVNEAHKASSSAADSSSLPAFPANSFLSDIYVKKTELQYLVAAGWTEGLLDAVALHNAGIDDGGAKYIQIAFNFNNNRINREALRVDMKRTIHALDTLVTLRWHPWRIALLRHSLMSYHHFVSICKTHAKNDFEHARSLRLRGELSFQTVNGVLCAKTSGTLPTNAVCIAYAIALNDPTLAKGVVRQDFIGYLQERIRAQHRGSVLQILSLIGLDTDSSVEMHSSNETAITGEQKETEEMRKEVQEIDAHGDKNNEHDMEENDRSDVGSESTDDDVVIIQDVLQPVALEFPPDTSHVNSPVSSTSFDQPQEVNRDADVQPQVDDVKTNLSSGKKLIPNPSVVQFRSPNKDDLTLLRNAGLTDELLDGISRCCLKDDLTLTDIEEEFVRHKNNSQALLMGSEATIASLNSLVTMKWHPWHAAMAINSVFSYDEFLSLSAQHGATELIEAISERVQKQVSLVVSNGVCTVGNPDFNNIPLTIAYVTALHESSKVHQNMQHENFISIIQSNLRLKRHHAVNLITACLRKITTDAEKPSDGMIEASKGTSGDLRGSSATVSSLPSFPLHQSDIAVLESQYYLLYMQSPRQGARFMYEKCIELLDMLSNIPVSQRDNAKRKLASRYGATLFQSESEDVTVANERLWHNYLKLHKELSKSSG